MVRLGELNPNNWAPLLALRDELRSGGVHGGGHASEGDQDDDAAIDDIHSEPSSNVVTRIRHPKYRPASKEQRRLVLDLYRQALV